MKIILDKRNSPSRSRNSLKYFERFDSILLSLTEATEIEVEVDDGEVILRNKKYYLALPSDSPLVEMVLNSVVLRRFRLGVLDVLRLYSLMKDGVIRAGKRLEGSSEEKDRLPFRNCYIEIAS
jgi:hypothetical protein